MSLDTLNVNFYVVLALSWAVVGVYIYAAYGTIKNALPTWGLWLGIYSNTWEKTWRLSPFLNISAAYRHHDGSEVLQLTLKVQPPGSTSAKSALLT